MKINKFYLSFLMMFTLPYVNAFSQNNNVEKFNRNEKYIYNYYSNNSQKLKAAHFLLSNMKNNFHVDNGIIVLDKNSIDPKFIIHHIDDAFYASAGLLSENIIDFDSFLEYTLPYRVNYSKDEEWRAVILKRPEAELVIRSKTEDQLINAINSANHKILSNFKFDLSNTREDTLSYSDICNKKKGSCIMMATMGQYYFRALGVPVSYDYVLCWGNMNGGHTWNALILPHHKSLPFLGLEQQVKNYNPILYFGGGVKHPLLSTYKKAGKVYRHTYSIQNESLAYQYKGTDTLPPILQNYRLVDVTSQYYKVTTLHTDKFFHDIKSSTLLICNYSSGQWVPITAAANCNNNYVFENLGVDMLYLFTTYSHKIYKPRFYPIFIDAKGNILSLKPGQKKINIKLNYLKSVEADQAYFDKGYDSNIAVATNKLRRRPVKGESYTLYLWQNGWKKSNVAKCLSEDEISFDQISENALYMVSTKEVSADDRPFIVYRGKIKWL